MVIFRCQGSSKRFGDAPMLRTQTNFEIPHWIIQTERINNTDDAGCEFILKRVHIAVIYLYAFDAAVLWTYENYSIGAFSLWCA